MTTFRFQAAAVRRVVAHATAATAHDHSYGPDIGPAVLLMGDRGVYLTSSGLPPDMDGDRPFGAFADGLSLAGRRRRFRWVAFTQAIPLVDFTAVLESEPGVLVTAVVLRLTDTKVYIVAETQPLAEVSA